MGNKERLQKILSARGVASRRKAEQMILAGEVLVNGTVAGLGDLADPSCDSILINGKPLPQSAPPVYIMLHKPKGYVTTLSDEKGRPNAASLVKDCGQRVYPVGRLDMDSEGLLLFTSDGDMANRLMHPRSEVNKIYHVWVEGFTPEKLEKVSQPIVLDGYLIRRPQVRLIKAGANPQLEIMIHEGRNRQVRRMCQAAGMRVRRLVRVAEGNLTLGDLAAGSWRYLTEEEVAEL